MDPRLASMSLEDQADQLERVMGLATSFSTCVEAFGLIHPSKLSDRPQKLALARLGIEQARLLVFGDVVGISSPPRTIATHMIPSQPGALNPDPNEPVNFGERDSRLDDAAVRQNLESTLNEILDRPSSSSRDEVMGQYGLKPPKKPLVIPEPALDTNRLEAFREKYGLLQDLNGQYLHTRRGASMTTQHWLIVNVDSFESFVKLVRDKVDDLVKLLDVQERVDRGMNIDIKAMGWHPDVSGPVVRRDWEKLKLIAEATKDIYPDYHNSTEHAIDYLNRTWREVYRPSTLAPALAKEKALLNAQGLGKPKIKENAIDQRETRKIQSGRPNWFKALLGKHKSEQRTHTLMEPRVEDTQRSKSVDVQTTSLFSDLERARSKSLSATDNSSVLNLSEAQEPTEPRDAVLTSYRLSNQLNAEHGSSHEQGTAVPANVATTSGVHGDGTTLVQVNTARTAANDESILSKVDTYNSLIERHDRFPGIGRTETKDIRDLAHTWR